MAGCQETPKVSALHDFDVATHEVRTKGTSRWGCRSRLQRLQVAIMLGNFLGVMRDAVKMKHKLAGGGVNLQQETQFLCACWTYGILAMQQNMSLKQPPPRRKKNIHSCNTTKEWPWMTMPCFVFFRRIQHGLMKTHSVIFPLRTETESAE